MKDYKYFLEKVEVEKGKRSLVPTGSTVGGPSFAIKRDDEMIHRPDFTEVKEGDMILVTGRAFWEFIKTSPVSEIVDIAQDRLVFKTTSSTYVLTRTEEPEEFDEEELVA